MDYSQLGHLQNQLTPTIKAFSKEELISIELVVNNPNY